LSKSKQKEKQHEWRSKTMKIKPMALFFILFALVSVNIHALLAQTASPTNIELTQNSGLNDYLAYAALNNPGLKAAFNRWKAAEEQIPQVGSLPDPQLTFAYFIRPVETRVGPQQQKLGVMQRFPWFGKLKLKASAAREAAHARKQAYETLKLNLFFRVKNAFYEFYYLTRAISVIKENKELLEFLEKVVRMKYRTGEAAYSDLIKVQVELDKLQDWLQSTEEQVRPVGAQLNSALNRPVREPLPPLGIIQPEEVSVDYSQLASLLKENNPQLKTLDHFASREKLGIRLARKNYFPDFSLGVDYIFTGDARMPGVADSGKDPLLAMMTVNLPLGLKKIKASVREARARYDSAQAEMKEKENGLLAHLEMVYYQFSDSGRKLELYKDALIPRAKQALEVARAAFAAGEADVLNLIDSQRTLLGFELAYQRSLATRAQRLVELEMLVGKEF
jgi:outer membrane protein, heavy metal efflux system